MRVPTILAIAASTVAVLPRCYRQMGGIDVRASYVLRVLAVSGVAAALSHLMLTAFGTGACAFVAAPAAAWSASLDSPPC